MAWVSTRKRDLPPLSQGGIPPQTVASSSSQQGHGLRRSQKEFPAKAADKRQLPQVWQERENPTQQQSRWPSQHAVEPGEDLMGLFLPSQNQALESQFQQKFPTQRQASIAVPVRGQQECSKKRLAPQDVPNLHSTQEDHQQQLNQHMQLSQQHSQGYRELPPPRRPGSQLRSPAPRSQNISQCWSQNPPRQGPQPFSQPRESCPPAQLKQQQIVQSQHNVRPQVPQFKKYRPLQYKQHSYLKTDDENLPQFQQQSQLQQKERPGPTASPTDEVGMSSRDCGDTQRQTGDSGRNVGLDPEQRGQEQHFSQAQREQQPSGQLFSQQEVSNTFQLHAEAENFGGQGEESQIREVADEDVEDVIEQMISQHNMQRHGRFPPPSASGTVWGGGQQESMPPSRNVHLSGQPVTGSHSLWESRNSCELQRGLDKHLTAEEPQGVQAGGHEDASARESELMVGAEDCGFGVTLNKKLDQPAVLSDKCTVRAAQVEVGLQRATLDPCAQPALRNTQEVNHQWLREGDEMPAQQLSSQCGQEGVTLNRDKNEGAEPGFQVPLQSSQQPPLAQELYEHQNPALSQRMSSGQQQPQLPALSQQPSLTQLSSLSQRVTQSQNLPSSQFPASSKLPPKARKKVRFSSKPNSISQGAQQVTLEQQQELIRRKKQQQKLMEQGTEAVQGAGHQAMESTASFSQTHQNGRHQAPSSDKGAPNVSNFSGQVQSTLPSILLSQQPDRAAREMPSAQHPAFLANQEEEEEEEPVDSGITTQRDHSPIDLSNIPDLLQQEASGAGGAAPGTPGPGTLRLAAALTILRAKDAEAAAAATRVQQKHLEDARAEVDALRTQLSGLKEEIKAFQHYPSILALLPSLASPASPSPGSGASGAPTKSAEDVRHISHTNQEQFASSPGRAEQGDCAEVLGDVRLDTAQPCEGENDSAEGRGGKEWQSQQRPSRKAKSVAAAKVAETITRRTRSAVGPGPVAPVAECGKAVAGMKEGEGLLLGDAVDVADCAPAACDLFIPKATRTYMSKRKRLSAQQQGTGAGGNEEGVLGGGQDPVALHPSMNNVIDEEEHERPIVHGPEPPGQMESSRLSVEESIPGSLSGYGADATGSHPMCALCRKCSADSGKQQDERSAKRACREAAFLQHIRTLQQLRGLSVRLSADKATDAQGAASTNQGNGAIGAGARISFEVFKGAPKSKGVSSTHGAWNPSFGQGQAAQAAIAALRAGSGAAAAASAAAEPKDQKRLESLGMAEEVEMGGVVSFVVDLLEDMMTGGVVSSSAGNNGAGEDRQDSQQAVEEGPAVTASSIRLLVDEPYVSEALAIITGGVQRLASSTNTASKASAWQIAGTLVDRLLGCLLGDEDYLPPREAHPAAPSATEPPSSQPVSSTPASSLNSQGSQRKAHEAQQKAKRCAAVWGGVSLGVQVAHVLVHLGQSDSTLGQTALLRSAQRLLSMCTEALRRGARPMPAPAVACLFQEAGDLLHVVSSLLHRVSCWMEEGKADPDLVEAWIATHGELQEVLLARGKDHLSLVLTRVLDVSATFSRLVAAQETGSQAGKAGLESRKTRHCLKEKPMIARINATCQSQLLLRPARVLLQSAP